LSLLERILLEAEVLELQANPRRKATGFVVEARLEPGMGPTATLLVKAGTLEVGQAMGCGSAYGKIKALINDKGHKVRSAGPSSAVKCLGLNSVPEAGQRFDIFKNDREARAAAEMQSARDRQESLQGAQRGLSLDDLFAQTDSVEKKELPIVLKCDVQGSLEAIEQSLGEIQSEKVNLNMILTGVGNITVNDVLLAKASQGLIIGFHVGKENGVSAAAKREEVEIRLYSVIYELIDDVKRAMTGLLEPEYRENIIGHAEIREIFDIGKTGRIAGCMVSDGRVRIGSKARVKRGSETLYEGSIGSLKRFQSDAKEVRDGQECGIGLDNFTAFDRQDVIECYEMERLAQSL
jgi:translation initiation factor IF-2